MIHLEIKIFWNIINDSIVNFDLFNASFLSKNYLFNLNCM